MREVKKERSKKIGMAIVKLFASQTICNKQISEVAACRCFI